MKKRTKSGNGIQGFLYPLLVLVVLVIGLEVGLRVFNVPTYVLPTPIGILTKTVESFPEILPHFLFTLRIVVMGFTVAIPLGILLAALFSQFDILVKAVTPVIIWVVITPMITLIPLLMLWLGTDPNLRVIVVIAQATPIITLNTLNGFINVESEKLELARAVGASKFQTFTSIVFMNALPQVFTGIKLGCIFSTIGAVSADFVAGSIGLGDRIIQFTRYNLTEQSYGCIILIALIGISIYTIVQTIENRIILWKN